MVAGDKRKKKAKRIAKVDVRFKKVNISRSKQCINKDICESIELYAVEAEERDYNGKDKICWRLLTTHKVSCLEDAINIIECYRKRWYIEQLFRLLKKQGFAIEESQLESGWAIRKLSVLALNAVLRVIQLMHACDEETAQPIDEVFTGQEQDCLKQVNHQLKGKQSNPYHQCTLLWSKWIIARLGGWKGYKSERVPGPITLKRGLDNFNQIFNGWCLALKLYEDVGTR
jgi:transposase